MYEASDLWSSLVDGPNFDEIIRRHKAGWARLLFPGPSGSDSLAGVDLLS